MDLITETQKRVECYLELTKMSPTRFGLTVAKSPSLIKFLREGKIGLRRIRRITEYLDAQQVQNDRPAA